MKIAIIVAIILAVLYYIGAQTEKKEKKEQAEQKKKDLAAFDLNTPEYWSKYLGGVLAETYEGTYADAQRMHSNRFAEYIAVAASMKREEHLDGLVELQAYLLPYEIVWLLKDEKGVWVRVENAFNDFKADFRSCIVFEDCPHEDVISEFLTSTSRSGISALGVMLKKSLLRNDRLVLETDGLLPYCTLRVKVLPAPAAETEPDTPPEPATEEDNARAALEAQMRALLKEKQGKEKE